MKKTIVILGILIISAIVVVGGMLWKAGQEGTSPVEGWIASQLQLIANSYLAPEFAFTDLDYQYPGTVRLAKLRLTVDDPRSAGQTIDILSCEEATLTLAEIPQVGQPIVIERISLREPQFAAVAMAPGSRKFAGYSDMLRVEPGKAIKATTQKVENLPRLSDHFQMKLIEVMDGRFLYDPRIAGAEPMMLDQINTRLDIAPAQPGVYGLNFKIVRDPVFSIQLSGKLDLDRFQASDAALQLSADLSAEKLDYLPPQLQKILQKYEARGALNLTASGEVPIMHPQDGTLEVSMQVTRANFTSGDYRIPLDSLDLAADFREKTFHVSQFKVAALQGEANLNGSLQMNKSLDGVINLNIQNMQLQDLLSSRADGDATKLAGRVNASVKAEAPFKVVVAKTKLAPDELGSERAQERLPDHWGEGQLELTDGNLVFMPVIREINNAMRSATGLLSGTSEPRDQLKVAFKLSENRAIIEDMQFSSNLVAARGKGSIWLDDSVDLLINGGPLEKMQSMLGPVGKAIGAVTDQIVAYRVTGTRQQPKVAVQVGDGAVGHAKNVGEKVGEGAVKGAEKIGEGIGNILGIGK